MDTFGSQIRQRRELKGWSLERLAEAVQVDRTFVCKIENGSRNPSIDVARDIARALGIEGNALWRLSSAYGQILDAGADALLDRIAQGLMALADAEGERYYALDQLGVIADGLGHRRQASSGAGYAPLLVAQP